MTRSLCFISLLFVTILLCCFTFLFLFLGFALHNIHAFNDTVFCYSFQTPPPPKKRKGKGRKNVFYIIFLVLIVKVGHIIFTYHVYLPCLAWMSLFYCTLLVFSFVVHAVWELFIVFDHLILILKSHAFDCWTWT